MSEPQDITDLDAAAFSEEGVDVKIINPRTMEPTGLVIRVQGALSEKFQERMSQLKRRSALRDKNAVARATPEEDNTAEVLAAVTLGWEGMVEAGVEVPFSRKEAQRIYAKYPVIRGQVLAEATELANFVKG